ncbi:MAG: hypothetical protein QXM92_02915 [Candidatus Anstonellales archaeon]
MDTNTNNNTNNDTNDKKRGEEGGEEEEEDAALDELLREVFSKDAHEDILYSKDSSNSDSNSSNSSRMGKLITMLINNSDNGKNSIGRGYYYIYKSIGDRDGQIADYRIVRIAPPPPPHSSSSSSTPTTTTVDLRSIHIKVYNEYYKVHWDYVDPSKNPLLHLLLDAPHWLEKALNIGLRLLLATTSDVSR